MDARKYEKLNERVTSNTLRDLVIDGSVNLNYSQVERLVESIKDNISIKSVSFLHVSEVIVSYILLAFVHHRFLKKVNIRHRALSLDFALTLQVFLKENKSVIELDMADCDMSDRMLDIISPAFSVNLVLNKLILNNNKFTKQSAFLFFLHLALNNSIRKVSLAGNLFNEEAVTCLSEAIRLNPAINNIILSGNWLSPSDAANLIIYDGIPRVRRIYIANNALGDMGAGHFSTKIMMGRHALKAGDVSSNAITALGFSDIVKSLKSSTSLRFFSCSVNPLGDEGALHLVELIGSCLQLETLLAENCGFGHYGSFKISNVLLNHPSITHFNLTRANFNGYALAGLSLFNKANFYLKIIDISHCHIGGEVVPLLKEVTLYPSLTMLFLSDNRIGTAGAKAIGELLQENRWLEALSISGNRLADTDGDLIVAGLVENSALNYLDLTHNHLSSKTAVGLAGVFSCHDSVLKDLKLAYNLFDTNAVILLMQALRVNITLRHIDLKGCPVVRDWFYQRARMYSTEEMFIDLLTENHGICQFDLDEYLFDTSFALRLNELLAINRKIERLLCNYHSDVAIILSKIKSLIASKGLVSPVIHFISMQEHAFLRCVQYACVSGRISRDDFTELMKSSMFSVNELAVFFDKVKSLFVNKYNPVQPLYRLGLFSSSPVEANKSVPSIKLSLNF